MNWHLGIQVGRETVVKGPGATVWICVASFLAACSAPAPEIEKKPAFELHPDLEMNLFAAEPDVIDPVALTFDEAGRMYVVEMRDYPLGAPDGQPRSTIRLLEDTDGDGRADRSIVFAEGLSFPTSIAPWRGGVFVTAPPQLIYLKDTDGDGRADLREVTFEGVRLGVTDSNLNGLRWGLDNRIHGVNGGNGGRLRSTLSGAEVDLGRRDFSFDPRTGELVTTFHTSGGFGLVFDPWGRSFSTYNIDHLQQRILEGRYLDRARGLPPMKATENISVHGAMARIFPISVPETRVNHPEQAGYYSAAGGMGYLDWGRPGLPGGILICDVVGNLVSREELSEAGPIFRAERAPSERAREFLASRDNAFRPVGVEMGPDGALYVIDMQRAVIEHPDYIPAKVLRRLDLSEGSDRGRIYRVAPRRQAPGFGASLAEASPQRLVEALSSPLRWRRETAQRLLVERGEGPLEELAVLLVSGASPLGRLHALWTLDGLGALTMEQVVRVLGDAHAGVRENALRAAESFLPGSDVLRSRIVESVSDESTRVRFQAALTLGEVEAPQRIAALTEVLLRDGDHRWSRIAALSSLGGAAAEALALVLDVVEPPVPVIEELAALVAVGGGRETGADWTRLLRLGADPEFGEELRLGLLRGLVDGLGRAAEPPAVDPAAGEILNRMVHASVLATAATGPVAAGRAATIRRSAAAWQLLRRLGFSDAEVREPVLALAILRSKESSLESEVRVTTIDLLAFGEWGRVGDTLLSLLAAIEPLEIQARSLAVVERFDAPEIGRELLRRWRSFRPSLRPRVIRLLLRRAQYHDDLLAAIENGGVTLGELNLDLEQRRRLLRGGTPEIQQRAARLISDEEYHNRNAVVDDWLERLPQSGSVSAGFEVYKRSCAQCHVAGSEGFEVGPDLASLAHRSVEDLLSNILDPSMAVNPKYVTIEVRLESGASESGILEAESVDSLTLLQAFGERKELRRAEIVEMSLSAVSLMPAGLEEGYAPQDLRDLIAFIQEGPG